LEVFMQSLDGWITPSVAARRLGITPSYVRKLALAGRLRYEQTPLGRLIDPASVREFAATHVRRADLRDREAP
jgi:excisionase family DNA binding protein